MTTTNSDKLKLHRGSISSASVPNDHHSTQRPRYARSRLTIIPSSSTPVPSPQKPAQKPSRTSFSTSSFSRRELIPELPVYSQPLNPQQLYDLAISSLRLPNHDVAEGAVVSTNTASIGKFCFRPIPVTNGVCLPFVDRKSEVASLFQHPVNTSFSKLVEVVFSDRKQLCDFRRFVFETSREEADDKTWILTIRDILKPRSEILWTRLKTILGVPPELDEDDPQLHTNADIPLISDLSEISTDVTPQLIFPDQFTSNRRLVTPPRRNGRLRADTQPIIEEVESTTPTDDTGNSQHEQHENNAFPSDAAGICIQTTPLFVPGITSIMPKPDVENFKERGARKLKRRGETNEGSPFQNTDGSSPSAASYSSSSRNNKRPKYHPIRSSNRDRNKFSPLTNSDVIPETGEGNKEEEQGEKSDVSDTSSASTPSDGSFQHSGVITGTGDVAKPRKPSLQRDRRALDIPSRDLPTVNVEHPPAREYGGDEKCLDESTRGSPFDASLRRSDSPIAGPGSPALSASSFLGNAISPHPSGSSYKSTGRPRFPASFSQCKPPLLPSSPEFPVSARDMRAGHSRSRTVSYPASIQYVDSSVAHTYPPPPPPTPTTPSLDKKDTRSPRRAVSLIQRHPHRPSGLSRETCDKNKDHQQADVKEEGRLFVEVEGPMGDVRGSVNPLSGMESTD